MQKPNLDQMWETFIKFSRDDVPLGKHIEIIRKKIRPLISRLKDDGLISWYSFLVHDRNSGVPTTQDDNNPYFHIRFETKEGINPKDFLPTYCVLTRKIERDWVKDISIGGGLKFNTFMLKDESIEEVWRIIGEQSEWLLCMLDVFKDDIDVPLQYVGQLLHYFANMTMLRIG
jgi:hypothetical protein